MYELIVKVSGLNFNRHLEFLIDGIINEYLKNLNYIYILFINNKIDKKQNIKKELIFKEIFEFILVKSNYIFGVSYQGEFLFVFNFVEKFFFSV